MCLQLVGPLRRGPHPAPCLAFCETLRGWSSLFSASETPLERVLEIFIPRVRTSIFGLCSGPQILGVDLTGKPCQKVENEPPKLFCLIAQASGFPGKPV